VNIPIENIYYLLCYAWNKLEAKDRVAVSGDDYTTLIDLFAKVLINATKMLLKRGICKSYVDKTEGIAGVKGKLEFSQTLKRNLHHKQKTICTFDEFSENILLNQILVTTLFLLLRIRNVDQLLKQEVKSLLWKIPGIQEINLSRADFQKIRLNRNNHFYHFILNVCQIIFENTLPSEEKGEYIFSDFTRDDSKMNRLFEAFIKNFYQIELHNRYNVRSESISWQFDSDERESFSYLPQMLTDITLENDEEKIIIDAKYYREAMSVYYDKEKIKSANLYQLFSYLLNKEDNNKKTNQATGVLLYPTIEKEYDLQFRYQNHPIRIKTLNLDTHWKNIERRLKDIIIN
jgi:5-methylcytosine-specific restriction enzyme subunit McrC